MCEAALGLRRSIPFGMLCIQNDIGDPWTRTFAPAARSSAAAESP
jgi:hypothetical protein